MIITVNMLFLLLFKKGVQSIVLTMKEMQKKLLLPNLSPVKNTLKKYFGDKVQDLTSREWRRRSPKT